MVTSGQALAKYGNPYKNKNMGLVYLPSDLRDANPALPRRIYANIDTHAKLIAALRLCLERGVLGEIKVFSGCFNIRLMRGGSAYSLHSWGLAFDFNAPDNPMGVGFTYEYLRSIGKQPFTEKFLKCWRDSGFDCGGDWSSTKDRMHFQLSELP